jgi:hypothetical protein
VTYLEGVNITVPEKRELHAVRKKFGMLKVTALFDAKAAAELFICKDLCLSAGLDNILNGKRRGGHAGAGVRFEDGDIKYLFGVMPRMPAR